MNFIKVKADGENTKTKKSTGTDEFFLNTNLIKAIMADGSVYLMNDGNMNVSNDYLVIGDIDYNNMRVVENIDVNADKL